MGTGASMMKAENSKTMETKKTEEGTAGTTAAAASPKRWHLSGRDGGASAAYSLEIENQDRM